MKRLFILILAVFLVLMSYQAMAREVRTEDPNVFTNRNTFNKDVAFKSDINVDGTITVVGGVLDTTYGTGDKYYVDSNVAIEGDGSTWAKARNTVDEAINLCTANNGDIIYVAQGHAESYTAADGFDADVAGITIIMLGNGDDVPEFTFADTDATIAVGAANVTIIGGRYLAGISEVVAGISVEAGGDNFTLMYPIFPEPSTSTFEFDKTIVLAAGADGFTLYGAEAFSEDATGATAFLDLTTGVNNNTKVLNSYILGEYSSAPIYSDKADLEVLIDNCNISNTTNGEFAVEFTGNATGSIQNTMLRTDAQATALDPGKLDVFNVLWCSDTTDDVAGIPVIALEDGSTNFIGYDDNNNTAATTNVASNRDGSILERLEFINKYLETGTPGALVAPADTFSLLDILGSDGNTTTGAVAGSILGAIGTNETTANTPFASSTVQSDRDGSVLERLEFLNKYFETGTAGGLVAPADTRSLLDILGSDGTTTTGALAGSILGAIGTDEASANTPFASTSVQSDRDGSVLERLEHIVATISTGTPDKLTAPADTYTILDILGTDGSTTTGAVAGSILGAIGTNETAASTPFTSATVQSDRDGSVLERQEFITTFLATGTLDKLTAPADTYSILDILGTDGSTTTGAVAGSLLGAIGTNEATANTPFASTTVAADDDGSVLERLEFVQTQNGQVFVFPVTSSADTTHFVATNAIGFGDGYFVTGYMALVIYDVGGTNAAPEGEMVDITGYTSSTGTFTIGATTQLATGDIVMVARDEFFAPGMNAADAASDFSSSSVAPNADGTILDRLEALAQSGIYTANSPNYLAVSADFLTSSGWETVASHEIATVTGMVEMIIIPQCTETLTDAADLAVIQLGIAGSTDAIIAATDAAGKNGNTISTNEFWLDATPADVVVTKTLMNAVDVVVGGGLHVGYEITGAAMTDGTIIFHIFWWPLDATGAVVAGAGGSLS